MEDLQKLRKKAKKMYLQGKKYKDIAAAVGKSERTIQKWRQKENWQRRPDDLAKEHRSTNAKGNSGNRNAKAPPQNKNAAKTGEHEKLTIGELERQEKEMYQEIFSDPMQSLVHEIKMLQIRQRRMLQRLENAEKSLDPDERKEYYQYKNGKRYLVNEEITFTNKMNLVISIDEALTRVSKQLTNSLKQYQDMQSQQLKTDLIKLQKDKLEQEVKRMKLLNGDTDVRQDDGFIAALSDLASNESVWGATDD